MPYTFFKQCYKILDMYKISKERLDGRRQLMTREFYGEPPIEFNDVVAQCAYIRTDVPYHANVLFQIIDEHQKLDDLFLEDEEDEEDESDDDENAGNDTKMKKIKDLNVMSIGCGPGTDMIALIKYIFNHGDFGKKRLRLLLTDEEPAWEKFTDQFEKLIRQHQERSVTKINFSKKFQPWKTLDVEIPLPQIVSRRAKNTNLFIFNLFFSNFAAENNCKKVGAAAQNLKTILEKAMKGAIFLFVDIKREDAKLFRQVCLIVAGFCSGAVEKIGENSQGFKMPLDEQKSDLLQYLSSKCQPKLRHDKQIDFVIYQKL